MLGVKCYGKSNTTGNNRNVIFFPIMGNQYLPQGWGGINCTVVGDFDLKQRSRDGLPYRVRAKQRPGECKRISQWALGEGQGDKLLTGRLLCGKEPGWPGR